MAECHRSVALLCTGALQMTSYNSLLAELGQSSLLNRTKYYRLVLTYKIQNDLAPCYLCNILSLPPSRTKTNNYDLINATNITIPAFRTEKYVNLIFHWLLKIPLTIKDWNTLPLLLRDYATLVTFKSKLELFFFNLKKTYSVGSFNWQGLSSLRKHFIWHHIVDDIILLFTILNLNQAHILF